MSPVSIYVMKLNFPGPYPYLLQRIVAKVFAKIYATRNAFAWGRSKTIPSEGTI